MKKVIMSIIILVMIIGAFLAITYTRQPKSEEKPELEIPLMEKEKAGITLISVYDNYQVNPELKTGWGFGCVIKTEKEEILFDTGGNSEILLFNLKKRWELIQNLLIKW